MERGRAGGGKHFIVTCMCVKLEKLVTDPETQGNNPEFSQAD